MISISKAAKFGAAAAAAFIAVTAAANAAAIVVSDKTDFLSVTGATSATGLIPIDGGGLPSLTVGSVTFENVGANSLNFSQDWTTRIDDNQFAINGVEDLDVDFGGDIFAFGFDFVEPEFDPLVNATFVNSLFEISLCDNGVCFETFQFSVPNDVAAFVGVISAIAFDFVEIREITGGAENEFFGEFFTSASPISDVPLPAAAPLFLIGLAGAGLARRKRKSAA